MASLQRLSRTELRPLPWAATATRQILGGFERTWRQLREATNAGKTFGVISLVGDAQAREIETRLVRELGPEEIERRQIVCGDAYAFQGDERDVMFLSMVLAPSGGRSIPAMTDAAAQRRFNIAASRARNQLFLFHTATLADLNPQCVRYQLLEYCLNPSSPSDICCGLDARKRVRATVGRVRLRGNMWEV